MGGADTSTTFTDASPSARGNATVVDHAQIDTAQKKFSTGSLLLDGTLDYIYYGDHADWQLDAGDGSPFTVDTQVRFNSVAVTQPIFSQQVGAGDKYFSVWDNSVNKLYFGCILSSSWQVYISCPWTPSADTWYHIAVVRVNADNAATGWRLFIAGVSGTLTLVAGAYNGFIPDYSANFNIGTQGGVYYNGWMDEFRVSKGIARWAANFTPPSAPYGTVFPPGVGIGSPTMV